MCSLSLALTDSRPLGACSCYLFEVLLYLLFAMMHTSIIVARRKIPKEIYFLVVFDTFFMHSHIFFHFLRASDREASRSLPPSRRAISVIVSTVTTTTLSPRPGSSKRLASFLSVVARLPARLISPARTW